MRVAREGILKWHENGMKWHENGIKPARLAAGKGMALEMDLVLSGLEGANRGERDRSYKVRRDSPPLSDLFAGIPDSPRLPVSLSFSLSTPSSFLLPPSLFPPVPVLVPAYCELCEL